jgi:anti-sigma factor RsiW
MTRGTNQHIEDWDEQREWLSAYLDGELGAEERAALERHLPGCARCQAELADLRGVRALLRALPMPAAPRSFALPDDGAVPQPIAPAVARRSARQATGAWARAMEWVGSVAAVAGLLLLLGTALGGGPHGGAASTAGSSAFGQRTATAQAAQQGPKAGTAGAADSGNGGTGTAAPTQVTIPTPQQTRPSVVTGPGGERTPGATPGSPATPAPGASTPTHITTPAATPHVIQPVGNTSVATGESGSAGGGLPLAGVGLVLGGAALFAGGKAAERRGQRQQGR